MPASATSKPKIALDSSLQSFSATEAPSRQQSKSASNGRSHGRVVGENMPRAEAGAPSNGFS